jgi:predicted O-methyltransferase YrrM
VIIDAYQDLFYSSGWSAIAEAGLAGLCSLIEERSQTVLPRLLGEGFLADVAFVDGSHIFHNVFVDLFYLRELVRPGGLVILDDCSYPSVATAVRAAAKRASIDRTWVCWLHESVIATSRNFSAWQKPVAIGRKPAWPDLLSARPGGI